MVLRPKQSPKKKKKKENSVRASKVKKIYQGQLKIQYVTPMIKYLIYTTVLFKYTWWQKGQEHEPFTAPWSRRPQ